MYKVREEEYYFLTKEDYYVHEMYYNFYLDFKEGLNNYVSN